MSILKNSKSEKQSKNADERINSTVIGESTARRNAKIAVKYIVALASAAVIIAVLYPFNSISAYISSQATSLFSIIDNSSGFLYEAVKKILTLALAIVIVILFGFLLNINFSFKGRPKSEWGKQVPIAIAVAIAADLLFLLIFTLMGEEPFALSGTILSQVTYYITKICLVPCSNILLFLVIPSAMIGKLMSLMTISRADAEPCMIVATTIILTVSQLGMSWQGIASAGFAVIIYTLIQSAAYSVLYHRTNVVWYPVFLYAGVTSLYYIVSWLI